MSTDSSERESNPYAPSRVPVRRASDGSPDHSLSLWPSKRELLRTIWVMRTVCLIDGLLFLRHFVELVNKVLLPHPPMSFSAQIGLLAHPFALAWFATTLLWIGTSAYAALLSWQTASAIRKVAGGRERDPLPACRLFRKSWIWTLVGLLGYLLIEAVNYAWRLSAAWF